MLVFDQEQFEITGVYTLYTPNKTKSYTFENVLEAKAFIDNYYHNVERAERIYNNDKNKSYRA